MYAFYVMILNLSEDVFWNADFSFLKSVVENKLAYDKYVQYSIYLQKEKESNH